jgi:hypothetical protein
VPSDAIEVFPHARVSLDNGDIWHCTGVKVNITSNKKLVHLMRGKGITRGNEDTVVDIDTAVGEDGEEIDGVAYVKRNIVKQIRIKIPGRTLTVNGGFNTYALDGPIDSEIKISLNFIGHTED